MEVAPTELKPILVAKAYKQSAPMEPDKLQRCQILTETTPASASRRGRV